MYSIHNKLEQANVFKNAFVNVLRQHSGYYNSMESELLNKMQNCQFVLSNLPLCINDNFEHLPIYIDDKLEYNHIQYIVLHGLAHIACKTTMHPPNFWTDLKLFQIIAENNLDYEIVNYAEKPFYYKDILISYNPVYD